jgi:transglutaminase/protease-like cytokinesis protein 3
VNLRLPSSSKVFYTDMVAVPHQNKAILVRNDYKVFEIDASGDTDITSIEEEKVAKSFDNLLSSKTIKQQISYSNSAVESKCNGRASRGLHSAIDLCDH